MSSGLELPTIQSLWIGDELSVMERLCIASFLQNGHPFHLYAYSDIRNVPRGAVVKDAGELIPADRIFKYKDRDTYAGFSNVFRYKLLLERGNYWVDTDVVCLRPFNHESEYVFASAQKRTFFSINREAPRIQSCVIKTPRGSEIMDYCYTTSINRDPHGIVWGNIGPRLLRAAVTEFALENYTVPANTFCPIDWPEYGRLLNGSLFVTWVEWANMSLFNTNGIHLWNEMWRENQIDKNRTFPRACIYEELKRRYLGIG